MKEKVRARISNQLFNAMESRGVRRGLTARVVALAIDDRGNDFQQICYDLPATTREAAIELWNEFAPTPITKITIRRRSILEAPTLARATCRIAN